MFGSKRNKQQKIDTLISARTRIDGNVRFCGGLHLDGYINGDVQGETSGEATLWVSEQGRVEGSVMATHVVLNGLVKGDIDATGRVDLGENARVFGNVTYAVIESAVGAQINGKLIHRAKPSEGVQEAGLAVCLTSDEPPL